MAEQRAIWSVMVAIVGAFTPIAEAAEVESVVGRAAAPGSFWIGTTRWLSFPFLSEAEAERSAAVVLLGGRWHARVVASPIPSLSYKNWSIE